MASRLQALTDSFGSPLALTNGSSTLEIGFVSSDNETSVAGVVSVIGKNGATTFWPVAAGETFFLDMKRPRTADFLAFNVRALTGTPNAHILEF